MYYCPNQGARQRDVAPKRPNSVNSILRIDLQPCTLYAAVRPLLYVRTDDIEAIVIERQLGIIARIQECETVVTSHHVCDAIRQLLHRPVSRIDEDNILDLRRKPVSRNTGTSESHRRCGLRFILSATQPTRSNATIMAATLAALGDSAPHMRKTSPLCMSASSIIFSEASTLLRENSQWGGI